MGYITIMENQMEKKMGKQTDTRVYGDYPDPSI